MTLSLSRIGIILMCIVALAVLPAANAQQDDLGARVSRALEAIGRAVDASTRPAVVIGITDRTHTLQVFAKGYYDLKTKGPVTKETLIEIGSITKSFTAIALMQLFDEGRFDPRAPITKYIPWFQVKSTFEPITGHHLLTHTAGIPNYRPDVASMMSATYELRDFEPSYAPGEHFWYSNIGFQTLGYALERIERKTYPEIIRSRIFDKLDMGSSYAVIDDQLRSKLPVSYSMWPYNNEYVEQPWFEYAAADGSISATAGDMSAYARLLLNRGNTRNGRLISEKAFDMLTKPELNNYAYGLDVRQADGDTIIGHGGGIAGFASLLEVHMKDGFAIVVLSNAGYDGNLVQWVGNTLKAAYRNQPLPAFPNPPAPPTGSEWAGVYKSPITGKTVEFVGEGNRLSLKQGDSVVPLTRIGRDAFRGPLIDPVYPFVFERQGGKVAEVSYGPEWYANDAYTGPKEFNTPQNYAAYVGRYENHNPEGSFVRVFIRKGQLLVASGIDGSGRPLVPAGDATFRPKDPDYNPERYRFDSIVEGHALRMIVSGMPMYRVSAQ